MQGSKVISYVKEQFYVDRDCKIQILVPFHLPIGIAYYNRDHVVLVECFTLFFIVLIGIQMRPNKPVIGDQVGPNFIK